MNPSTIFTIQAPIASDTFFEKILHWIIAQYPLFVAGLKHLVGLMVLISIPMSVFLLIVIIYCVEQIKYIRKKEAEIFEAKVMPAIEPAPAGDHALSNRWEQVKKHVESSNQNDWKQAIIEADVILDDILNRMGYRGDSVGEKLKRADPAQFQSLQDAWEAHLVRNRVAHDGSAYPLDHHEARRVIQLYHKVFQEFYYV